MEIGISTACLYPETVEVSLKKMVSMGFSLFEVFFNTYSEIQPEFLHILKENCEGKNISFRSVHPFTSAMEGLLFFSAYERRFLDSLAFYEEYCKAARELGARYLVLHGQRDYKKSVISEEEYIDRFAWIAKTTKKHGIILAQENVNRFRAENPEFIRRMRKRLQDNCAFVLDIKQAVRAGYDPYEVCAAMGECLVHIHINDHTAEKDCLLPGKGSMDYKRFFRQLKSQGYEGDCIIEVYRNNFEKTEELLAAQCFLEQFREYF